MNSNETKKIKYSILHLYAGLALAFKERVHVEHWALVFSKPDKISRVKYEEGDFESISLDKTIDLLKEICEINFSKEHREAIDALRKLRNKIEHFSFTVSREQIKPLFARVLNVFVNFIDEHLIEYIDTEEESTFEDIKGSAIEFREYVEERIKHAQEQSLSHKKDLFHCPECRELALIRYDDDYKCFACELKGVDATSVAVTHLEECLETYYDPNCDWPLYDCPECTGNQVLVPRAKNYLEFICVSCGEIISREHMHFCNSCGEVFYSAIGEKGSGCCSNCWDLALGKD
ncbi:MAG: hypothetical protein H6623_02660 [Bdellovibrionaceae bacterium]|nr:hypothetical protein [Pseudobdellovibrionaceae bacterium]